MKRLVAAVTGGKIDCGGLLELFFSFGDGLAGATGLGRDGLGLESGITEREGWLKVRGALNGALYIRVAIGEF